MAAVPEALTDELCRVSQGLGLGSCSLGQCGRTSDESRGRRTGRPSRRTGVSAAVPGQVRSMPLCSPLVEVLLRECVRALRSWE